MSAELSIFESLAKKKFESILPDLQTEFQNKEPQKKFIDAMKYSFFNGGKRIRPFLSFQIARMIDLPFESVIKAALATELIHTYSLIHDDLPCMDDSNQRRGLPSNHKVYGEAPALLAGNALLTEAFSVLAKNYKGTTLSLLIKNMSHFTQGMIFGQFLDTFPAFSEKKSFHLYKLKTANLIIFSAIAPTIIKNLNANETSAIKSFALNFGLAFQLKDDLLGFKEDPPEQSYYINQHGAESCEKKLNEISEKAKKDLSLFKSSTKDLIQIIEYNITRDS